MIEIIREFVIKEEAQGRFELAYGPDGVWSTLFAGNPGFRGTTLPSNLKNTRRYLVIDLWDTLAQREQMLTEHKVEYAKMDVSLPTGPSPKAKWVSSE